MEQASVKSIISPRILRDQLVTLGDLQDFKEDLLLSLSRLLRDQTQKSPRKWLKSREVKALLNISSGTLYSMRINSTLPFPKIGNTIYYDAVEVNAAIAGQKSVIPLVGMRPVGVRESNLKMNKQCLHRHI